MVRCGEQEKEDVPMSRQLFTHEVRDGIAWVTFDSGGMNTISAQAIEELWDLVGELEMINLQFDNVVLKGNKFGLGSGADIHELMHASRDDLARLIDQGHEVLFKIEEFPVPWLAVVDGFALGGILELALACRGIIATAKSVIGFPEIRLNIFPGLGGTQRAPRRCGLVNATDPMNGQAGFTAILTGRNFKAREAEAIRLIDAVVPDGEDTDVFALRFLKETLPTLDRTLPPDLAQAESLKPMVLPTIKKATMGRPRPRAPYVALDVMVKGATLPLREAIKLERDAFLEIATSSEGKAGMRFFFAQQSAMKLPKGCPGKPKKIRSVGVAGIDGFMGNAIAWLALAANADYQIAGYIPADALRVMDMTSQEAESAARRKIRAKYGYALKKGDLTEEIIEQKIASVAISNDLDSLWDCDLVIEAIAENRGIKEKFHCQLGAGLKTGAIAASNSSSMGPSILTPFFKEGGGDPTNYVNLHFFGPADRMPLVEIVVGEKTSPDTVATVHEFTRKIGKTPVILKDGSIGFLVNAGLAAYLEEAEKLYAEGTPLETIDSAMHQVFPMGPFEVCDNSGVDVAAGMLDAIAVSGTPSSAVLITKLRDLKRFGMKSGGGFYDYEGGKKTTVFAGLAGLLSREDRIASDEEIVERCTRALYRKARELSNRGIVASDEECDLAFVFGIGFAMYLGGPIFYGKLHGWDKEA